MDHDGCGKQYDCATAASEHPDFLGVRVIDVKNKAHHGKAQSDAQNQVVRRLLRKARDSNVSPRRHLPQRAASTMVVRQVVRPAPAVADSPCPTVRCPHPTAPPSH